MMKQLVLLMVAMLAGYSMNAAPALKVANGNWADVVQEETLALVEFEYSNTTWEKKESYKTFCEGEYEQRVENSIKDFVAGFNKQSSNLKLVNDDPKAKYKLIFRINNLERKLGTGFQVGKFRIKVYGQIEVVDLASNDCVCKIIVNGHVGGWDYVPNDRLSKCFTSLGEELLNLKK